MDEDQVALVEKIIKELNHVLMKPGLTDFDIIPAESDKNKSPVMYEHTSVGLESWCVKPVYLFCYSELMDDFLANPNKRLSKPSHMNCERLTILLNTALLINPDITTLWNKRREMLDKNLLEWVSELQFSRLVLSRKPKCNEAYAYRKWILEDVFKDIILSEEVVHPYQFIDAILTEELSICDMVAEKATNNYHGWEYRRWLMNTAWSIRYDFDCILLYFSEYRFVLDWSQSHVSEYSSLNYRQFLLKRLYYISERWNEFEREVGVNLRAHLLHVITMYIPNDSTVKPKQTFRRKVSGDDLVVLILGHRPGNCKCYATFYSTCRKLELLFYELDVNNELIEYYKNHETLWYHRRFIVHEILDAMYTHLEIEKAPDGRLERKEIFRSEEDLRRRCKKCLNAGLKEHSNKVEKHDIYWVYLCPLFKVLIRHEKKFMSERRKDSDKYYIDKHEHFLNETEGLRDYM